MYKHTFTEDLPGKHKRTGDSIIVIGGDEFMNKLSQYPEGQPFYVNDDWSPTIRGGNRVGGPQIPASASPNLHAATANRLMQNLAEEAARVNLDTP